MNPLHSFWIVRLGGILQRVMHAKTATEAREIAREGLTQITDPVDGVKDIDQSILVAWRVSALRKEEDE